MWLIGNKTNIEDYIAKVDKAEGFTGDITTTWATPRKHPTKDLYAVQKNARVTPDTNFTEKQELPDDWQPNDQTL